MDYCSTCRRHLNGALVCPGCGAYAPDIAPAAADGRFLPAPVATAVTGTAAAPVSTALDTWHDDAVVGVGMERVPQTDPSGDPEGVPTSPQGRAARRRQRARWKKNQRRAVVATTFALVGGGLTLASTARQPDDRAQTATAPTDPRMGTVEEQTAQDPRPTSVQPDADRTSATRPPAQAPAPDPQRRQYATTSLYTPSNTQPDAAARPRTTTESGPRPQSAATPANATAPDLTDTANTTANKTTNTTTTPAQTPAPAADGGTDTGTSQASAPPAATSPSQVCLLVLCLG